MTDKDLVCLYGYIKITQLLQIAIAASVKHNFSWRKIKVCLWNTDYAPGSNKVQKSYF